MKCNKCGAPAWTPGKYMIRVNEVGVDGVFECRPNCGHEMSQEDALLRALDDCGVYKPDPPGWTDDSNAK